MKIAQLPDKVLADMVRNGAYTRGETIANDGQSGSSKYLLVLAVPYGPKDSVETLPEAFESFRELLSADDWDERNIMVLYVSEQNEPEVREVTYETL